MLAPHHRKDPELGHVRRAPEDRDDALEFLLGQPMLGGQRRCDVASVFQEPRLASPSPSAGRGERGRVRGVGATTSPDLTNPRLPPPPPVPSPPLAGGEGEIWGEVSGRISG